MNGTGDWLPGRSMTGAGRHLPLLATHTTNIRAIHAAAPTSQASAWSQALILRWPVSCVASESTTRNQTLRRSPGGESVDPEFDGQAARERDGEDRKDHETPGLVSDVEAEGRHQRTQQGK